MNPRKAPPDSESPEARREFLKKCGRFCSRYSAGNDATAISVLIAPGSASLNNWAWAP